MSDTQRDYDIFAAGFKAGADPMLAGLGLSSPPTEAIEKAWVESEDESLPEPAARLTILEGDPADEETKEK